MFTLCIPTKDRYDNFLSKNLHRYVENELIDEILIQDENGNDIDKIKNSKLDQTKIKLFKNETVLGPFLNKFEVCKKAKNQWIVLMDSDNFADKDYFITANNYIANTKFTDDNIILAPCFAKPRFDYRKSSGHIFKKGKRSRFSFKECLMNTGNYVINKAIINNLNISNEMDKINKSPSCDVIYFNSLCFEQLNMEIHVVRDMCYEHVVHDGSTYLQNCNKYATFNNYVTRRFRKLRV